MKNAQGAFWILLACLPLFAAGCRYAQPGAEAHEQAADAAGIPTQEYLVGATLFVQSAAEYRALCYQAYAIAEERLRAAMAAKPQKPAIITDLDETVLDNSAYTAWQIASENPYDPETWAQWTALAQAPAVPGASDFLHLADSLGVRIFYVSNRKAEERDATMRNMAALGLPQIDTAHFLLKTTTSDKSVRRQKIADAGYEVLLLLGDNLGDFDAQWDKQAAALRAKRTDDARHSFGTKHIVFPNPLYGSWEGALYNYNWGLMPEQRDSARRANLQPAALP